MASTPPASGPPVIEQRRLLVIIGALLLGMLLAALDQTIVATALWGKLGGQYGRKIFFQAAIVIFLVGSVLSGLSTSILELIAFRVIQGIGGGGLMIGAQAIVGDVVAPRDRAGTRASSGPCSG